MSGLHGGYTSLALPGGARLLALDQRNVTQLTILIKRILKKLLANQPTTYTDRIQNTAITSQVLVESDDSIVVTNGTSGS